LLSEMATTYYNFRKYNEAAKTWARLIDPSKEDNTDDLMKVGRAYYLGGKLKSADSTFETVLKRSPDYMPAVIYVARTFTKMDPDFKSGLAEPKFKRVLQVARKDSVKNESEMVEALTYLGYLNMENGNSSLAKDYYNRLINLNPNSKENKIMGYNGIASIESKAAGSEKTLEGKLTFLARASDAYNSILSIDPSNASARSNLKWVQDYQAAVRKGINPNEIKGVVTDGSGQPVAFASVRVKDTAAENYTNAKGEYKFEIPQGSEILIFSAKGYKTQEIAISKSRVYNVKLSQ